MSITKSDVARVAASWRSAGELFEVHGETMLDLADDWTAGAKAANLDPDSGGNRWETDDDGNTWAIPSDPTGEAALAKRDQFAAELRMRAQRMHADALWIRDAAHLMAPVVPPSTMNDPASDLWCSHHLKVGLCEIRYRSTLCRWCSEFKSLWKVPPPMSILKDRQQGKRITEKAIKSALEAEGHRLEEVNGVTKAVGRVRGRTGKPNQNDRAAKRRQEAS